MGESLHGYLLACKTFAVPLMLSHLSNAAVTRGPCAAALVKRFSRGEPAALTALRPNSLALPHVLSHVALQGTPSGWLTWRCGYTTHARCPLALQPSACQVRCGTQPGSNLPWLQYPCLCCPKLDALAEMCRQQTHWGGGGGGSPGCFWMMTATQGIQA
jgi:hypothetical protein